MAAYPQRYAAEKRVLPALRADKFRDQRPVLVSEPMHARPAVVPQVKAARLNAAAVVPQVTETEGLLRTTGAATPYLQCPLRTSVGPSPYRAARRSSTERTGDKTLGWWRVHTFPKDASGTPLAVRDVADTRTALAPGTVWDFTTQPFDGSAAGFYAFIEHGNPS